jgi:hypothetical protein
MIPMRFDSPSNFGPAHTATVDEIDFDGEFDTCQPAPTHNQMEYIRNLRDQWEEAAEESARLEGKSFTVPAWRDPASISEASDMIEKAKDAVAAARGVRDVLRRARLTVSAEGDEYENKSIYVVDGELYRIRISKEGNPYALLRSGGEWVYDRSHMATVRRSGVKITAEQAAAYGHEYDECVFCDQELSHPNSRAVGYGAKCADNHGLPWG